MEKFFKLKENNTKVSTEVIAGLTTFFAMAYILFVNPAMLSQAGTPDNPFPAGAIFLATIFASVAGTLVMSLFANVPYAQAPGMGLNAFFTYTVVFSLGFSWQQALAMVFLCGVINVLITITKVRKMIIKAIPISLQNAIGGGIGIFIAYIGLKNLGLLSFTADPGTYLDLGGTIVANSAIVPALVEFNNPAVIFAIISLVLMSALVILKVRGAVFISIVAATIIGIFFGVTDVSRIGIASNIGQSFTELGTTFGAAFGPQGLGSLFSDVSKIPLVLMTIFAFSLSDTFDTLGTFIGTGRRTGIFDEEDMNSLENSSGFKSKMDKALFADSVATSIGAVFGTSNTTTYVESAAGIGAGGRTGLTSLTTACMFLLSILLAPLIGIVPAQATAPALVIVGVMMLASFAEIKWTEMDDALPAFFAGIFMGFCYSISYGIAASFIFYCLVKVLRGKAKEVSPIIWVSTVLFILNFAALALLKNV
ncbi:MAG: NCS2 family permease [Clostridiales bacterium]|nr:NCS2 family permease [Clostridia bacterium]NLD03900.1 NCS2 family permease [Clostridiales bacterium]